jgi:antitoxin (DNA-binding transcriptional repressor) of toxin-antitoxin stability system
MKITRKSFKILKNESDYDNMTTVNLNQQHYPIMQTKLSKSKFKPKALEYLRLVEEKNQTLIITHNKRPVAKIVPYHLDAQLELQTLSKTVLSFDRPLDPVGADEWEAKR